MNPDLPQSRIRRHYARLWFVGNTCSNCAGCVYRALSIELIALGACDKNRASRLKASHINSLIVLPSTPPCVVPHLPREHRSSARKRPNQNKQPRSTCRVDASVRRPCAWPPPPHHQSLVIPTRERSEPGGICFLTGTTRPASCRYGFAQSCQASPFTRENSDTFAVTSVSSCRNACPA